MSMNKRLKEERERLKITQAKIAEIFAVRPQAVSKWETKGTIPIEKIATLATHGFDVQYILTGVRSTNLNKIQEQKPPYKMPKETTSPADTSLDARLSKLNDKQQSLVKTLVEELEMAARKASEIKQLVQKMKEHEKKQ